MIWLVMDWRMSLWLGIVSFLSADLVGTTDAAVSGFEKDGA